MALSRIAPSKELQLGPLGRRSIIGFHELCRGAGRSRGVGSGSDEGSSRIFISYTPSPELRTPSSLRLKLSASERRFFPSPTSIVSRCSTRQQEQRTALYANRLQGMVRLSTAFLIALSFRLLNALVSRTFFQPDEYWQALEVAHRLVFGYGYQSWEWRHAAAGAKVGAMELLAGGGGGGIRSPLYPFLFVPLFWILKVTGLDGTVLLVCIYPFSVTRCGALTRDHRRSLLDSCKQSLLLPQTWR